MSTLSGTLTILSAMFTPAILVSACGSLILTTSQRLSRSLDRQREVASCYAKTSSRLPLLPPTQPSTGTSRSSCCSPSGGRGCCNRP